MPWRRWIARFLWGLLFAHLTAVVVFIFWFMALYLIVSSEPSLRGGPGPAWFPSYVAAVLGSVWASVAGSITGPFFVPMVSENRHAVHWASVLGGFLAAGIGLGGGLPFALLFVVRNLADPKLIGLLAGLAIIGLAAGLIGGWLGGRLAGRRYPG